MTNFIFQKEVLGESKAMIPDTKKRLKTAIDDLKSFMVCLGYCVIIEIYPQHSSFLKSYARSLRAYQMTVRCLT